MIPSLGQDGDYLNRRPVLQLRVAQNSILDENEDRLRASLKNNDNYYHPYGNEVKPKERGCIPGEIALKRRRTGKRVRGVDDIYHDPSDISLESSLVPHFSHLNQLPIKGFDEASFFALTPDERRVVIEQEFQIGGIVGTIAEPAYEGKDLGKNDFVTEIGGIRSVVNNNPRKTILQGQLVLARAPTYFKHQSTGKWEGDPIKCFDGAESTKVTAVLEPFDPNDVVSLDTIMKFIEDLRGDGEYFKENCIPIEVDGVQLNNGVQNCKYLPRHWMQTFVKVICQASGIPWRAAAPDDIENVKTGVFNRMKSFFYNADNAVIPEAMENLTEMMNSYHRINHHIQSQVLGYALSDAPPNTRFDIKFGSYAL